MAPEASFRLNVISATGSKLVVTPVFEGVDLSTRVVQVDQDMLGPATVDEFESALPFILKQLGAGKTRVTAEAEVDNKTVQIATAVKI